MAAIPTLTKRQWRTIEGILPANRRDPMMIAAILYRETAGASVRDTCQIYGLTKSRLSEWSAGLSESGALVRILAELKLERAGPLQWRRGGTSSWQRYSTDGGRSVVAMKLDRFAEQLRARKGHESAG
jgi:hypothetical protein